MRKIQLTQGFVALVDDEDYEMVSEHNWYTHKDKLGKKYARRRRKASEYWVKDKIGWNLGDRIGMHRFVTNIHMIPGFDVIPDHIDGDGLNNQKDNLLLTSFVMNNKRKSKGRNVTSSIYKGVYLDKRSGQFTSRIRSNRELHYLGGFETEVEAAKAYDVAAAKCFGRFAVFNFPEKGEMHE